MIIYVDIDDTICYKRDKDSWEYDECIPYGDRIDKINKLYDAGDTIVYWTARGTLSGKDWRSVTEKQLNCWGAKYHKLLFGKPTYDLFIDDKNINSEVFFEVEKTTINRIDQTALQYSFLASALACGNPKGPWPKPKLVDYVRNENIFSGITYFTDKMLHLAPNITSDVKVAFLCEPKSFMPQIYEIIKLYEDHYDLIFTYDEDLLKRGEKYIFFPADVSVLDAKYYKIHSKSKLVSMIYSDKKQLPGHKLRFTIAEQLIPKIKFEDKIDLFGSGTGVFLENKADACIDYMFQLAIENSRVKNYYADKILDCFVTGCIPIYWGCPNIGDFFDERGILQFETASELKKILESLDEKKYNSMLKYAKINFEKALEYQSIDDWIYKKIKEKLGDKIV